MPLLGAILAVSAANNILPYYHIAAEVIKEADFLLLLSKPMLIIGLIDALLALFLFLSVTEIYPMLRFRMMIGLGYFGFFHWAEWYNGDPSSFPLMVCISVGSIGVYICTLTLNFILMVLSGGLGLLAMLAYMYYINFT